LFQNYPNPFNPNTIISYQLPFNSHTTISIYDLLGNEIDVLLNEEQSVGYHEVKFSGLGLTSGVYYYQIKVLSTEYFLSFVDTRKLVLLK